MKGLFFLKKITFLLAILTVSFCLFGCESSKQASSSVISSAEIVNKNSTDVRAMIKSGQINHNEEFKLGAKSEKIEEYFDNAAAETSHDEALDDHDHQAALDKKMMKDMDTFEMRSPTITFFYKESVQVKGIGFIASTDDPFDFKTGIDTPENIKANLGAPDEEVTPPDSEFFFIPDTPSNSLRLRYKIDKYQVDFYFVDGVLSIATICDTEIWTGYSVSY